MNTTALRTIKFSYSSKKVNLNILCNQLSIFGITRIESTDLITEPSNTHIYSFRFLKILESRTLNDKENYVLVEDTIGKHDIYIIESKNILKNDWQNIPQEITFDDYLKRTSVQRFSRNELNDWLTKKYIIELHRT
jgi:hypothetical protein